MTKEAKKFLVFLDNKNEFPKELKERFILEYKEWGVFIAVYNLGFQMGWNDRNNK